MNRVNKEGAFMICLPESWSVNHIVPYCDIMGPIVRAFPEKRPADSALGQLIWRLDHSTSYKLSCLKDKSGRKQSQWASDIGAKLCEMWSMLRVNWRQRADKSRHLAGAEA